MQRAAFIAHCPYELGDIVQVAIIEGMAVTGYPRQIGTQRMRITDILAVHSIKNNTVTFLYDLEGEHGTKRVPLIPWEELTRRTRD
jgi:hypothetical protein